MAENSSNDISYFIAINETFKSDLAGIRQWSNLKAAFDEGIIWIRDLNFVQVHSLEVKSIPYKTIFYEKQGKLFLQNSLLPHRNVPSLLWTPLDRMLPVKLPEFNHNYFGIHEKLEMQLVASENEVEADGMIVDVHILEKYLITAPRIRLQELHWTMLNNDKILLLGKPLLPISANVYWSRNHMMIPAGYDFGLYSLADSLNAMLNPGNDHLIIWDLQNTYALVAKNDLQPLSLSSFRKTLQPFISKI